MIRADCRVLDEDRSRTPVRRRSRHAATERTGGLRFGIFALTLALLLAGCQGNQGAASNVLPAPSRTSAKSAERYDLAADERRGGHTVRRHVGRSDAELRERLDQERNISSASTWTNLEVAEETVAQALADEHEKIERWEERGERRQNLALHYDAGRVIGRDMAHGATQSEPCTRAVVVLRADGPGFFVLTTYPEVR